MNTKLKYYCKNISDKPRSKNQCSSTIEIQVWAEDPQSYNMLQCKTVKAVWWIISNSIFILKNKTWVFLAFSMKGLIYKSIHQLRLQWWLVCLTTSRASRIIIFNCQWAFSTILTLKTIWSNNKITSVIRAIRIQAPNKYRYVVDMNQCSCLLRASRTIAFTFIHHRITMPPLPSISLLSFQSVNPCYNPMPIILEALYKSSNISPKTGRQGCRSPLTTF